jgi:hypothetical protein
MASWNELYKLSTDGDLGKMLASKFDGKRGHVFMRQDADLLIEFKSELETPSAGVVAQTVKDHYTKLGYIVDESKSPGPNMFEALVFFKEKYLGMMIICITTHYPLSPGTKSCNHIRITTTVL